MTRISSSSSKPIQTSNYLHAETPMALSGSSNPRPRNWWTQEPCCYSAATKKNRSGKSSRRLEQGLVACKFVPLMTRATQMRSAGFAGPARSCRLCAFSSLMKQCSKGSGGCRQHSKTSTRSFSKRLNTIMPPPTANMQGIPLLSFSMLAGS